MNVSRTVSLSATLTSRSRVYPEWLLGINRNPTLPTEPNVEVGNASSQTTAEMLGNKSHPRVAIIHAESLPEPPRSPLRDRDPVDGVQRAVNASAEVVEESSDTTDLRQAKVVHFPTQDIRVECDTEAEVVAAR